MIALLVIILLGAAIWVFVWAVRSRRIDPAKTDAARFLKGMSSEQEIQQKAVYFHDTSIASFEILNTPQPGLCKLSDKSRAWHTMQRTKKLMEGVSDPVLLINDMSRFPDDPCKPLTDQEKKDMAPVVEIADQTVRREFNHLEELGRQSQTAIMSRIAIWGSVGVLGLALLVSRCGK